MLRIALLKAIFAAGKREREFWLLKNAGIGKMSKLQFTICSHHPHTQGGGKTQLQKQTSRTNTWTLSGEQRGVGGETRIHICTLLGIKSTTNENLR